MPSDHHVAIVGAGPAGLTAAYELSQAGCKVSVFEQRDQIGGLARSILIDGHPVDRYYHFICAADRYLTEMVERLGIASSLRWAPGPTSYFAAGRLHPFTTPFDILGFSPISLLSRVRFGLQGMRARRFTQWEQIEHMTAEEWLVKSMGREAYEMIWLPLLQMKFGAEADRVSAPWIWHRIHRVITSRRSIFRPDQLGYLDGGTGTLLQALAGRIQDAGGEIHVGTPVRQITEKDGRATGVATDGGELAVDAVISTVPLPALTDLLPHTAADYAHTLSEIPFLGVVCLLIRLSHKVTSEFWVNVNDPRAPLSGFIEHTNLNPCPELNGEALVYIPLYMPVDDPRFILDERELVASLLTGLRTLFPSFDPESVIDCTVTRDSHAQALCATHFGKRVPSIAAPVPGLFITDSTQLYPADRNISGMIDLAQQAARQVLAFVD